MMIRWIVCSMACLYLVASSAAACAQSASESAPEAMVRVCDPICSDRPVSQINQELRDTREDDGRIAALESVAAQNPRAAHDLALRYFRGDGVQRNSYKALTWMRVAAENGNLNAQKALGRLYLTGLEEMGRDPQEARTWLSLAAKRGDRVSKRLLAEAEAAARSEEAEYKWLNRWRPQVYDWWQSGYRYYGTWTGSAWTWNYRTHRHHHHRPVHHRR